MSIRLETIETIGRGLKDWCKQTVPLFFLARFLSDRPIDWCLFLIGWKFLRSSTTYLFNISTCSNKEKDDDDINDNGNDNVVNHGDIRHHRLSCSSTTEFYTKNRNDTNKNINNNRSKNKISTLDKGSNNKSLTALPPVILSHVTCYLHPRDALSLDSVFQCCSIRMHIDIICHDIWKRLWYRDYGDVLLRWKVARKVFCTSLQLIPLSQAIIKSYGDDDNDDSWLEEQLSNCLDEMTMLTITKTTTTTISMKEFYFIFGECYIDYLLANKNTIDECLLGLHGHIFDFTHFAEYHPGLIDPILKECGGDATYFFEDIPHSYGARNIARRLCVLVNRNAINYSSNHSDDNININNSTSNISCSRDCGLELVLSPSSSSSSSSLSNKDNNESNKKDISKLKRLLRSTNTRPPPPSLSTAYSRNNDKDKNSKTNNNNSVNRNWWMPHVVPRRRKLQRPPTLERIRNQFQQEKQLQEQHFLYDNDAVDQLRLRSPSSSLFVTTLTKVLSSSSLVRFWNSSSNNSKSSPLMTRLYYDPFRQQWIRWDPNNPKL